MYLSKYASHIFTSFPGPGEISQREELLLESRYGGRKPWLPLRAYGDRERRVRERRDKFLEYRAGDDSVQNGFV